MTGDRGDVGRTGSSDHLRRVGYRLRRIGYRLRRVAFGSYHRLVARNYERGWIARPIRTPAGTVRTYELLDTHGGDPLLAALAEACGPDDVVVDVGAHVGVYALALTAEAPDRTVIAAEPDPESCRRLRQNLAATAPEGTVDARNLGLGDEDGTRAFHRSTYPKLSSFEPGDARRWEADVAETVAVPIRRLDSLVDAGEIPPPDHVKIDVEGHGPAVVRGARETLECHRPIIYVEPHDRPGADRRGAIESLLADAGYDVVDRGEGLVCRPATE